MRLAKGLLSQSRSRPGLMTLAVCLEAAALGSPSSEKLRPAIPGRERVLRINEAEILSSEEGPVVILELLKNVVENSKRHFNPKYREKGTSSMLNPISSTFGLI